MKQTQLMLLCCSIFCFLSSLAHADELSLGAGGAWSTSPYKKHDALILPVPVISYSTEHFYIRGFEAGAYLWKTELHTVSVGASYSALAFDSGKTDNRRMKKLNDRHSTVTADATYALQSEYGLLKAKFSQDILGNSNGLSADISYAYPLTIRAVHVRPALGMQWDSQQQTDYYFGVSGKEARKSGFTKYNPDATVSPYLSLHANWLISENWSLGAGGKVLFLGNEIKDSPMVDTSRVFSGILSLSYGF